MGICGSTNAKKERVVGPGQPKRDGNDKPGLAVIQNYSSIEPEKKIPAEPEEQNSVESTPPCSESNDGEQGDEMNLWDRGCETWEA
jgi:hypothetical protein